METYILLINRAKNIYFKLNTLPIITSFIKEEQSNKKLVLENKSTEKIIIKRNNIELKILNLEKKKIFGFNDDNIKFFEEFKNLKEIELVESIPSLIDTSNNDNTNNNILNENIWKNIKIKMDIKCLNEIIFKNEHYDNFMTFFARNKKERTVDISLNLKDIIECLKHENMIIIINNIKERKDLIILLFHYYFGFEEKVMEEKKKKKITYNDKFSNKLKEYYNKGMDENRQENFPNFNYYYISNHEKNWFGGPGDETKGIKAINIKKENENESATFTIEYTNDNIWDILWK
jgi:hypothetical protein